MTPDLLFRQARRLVLALGTLDVAVGLALALAPAAVLPLAGIAPPSSGEADVFLRWVGAFAAAVGATYLTGGLARDPGALRHTLRLTLPFRAGSGLFVSAALLRGALPGPWTAVAAVNLGLVLAQSLLLAKGAGDEN